MIKAYGRTYGIRYRIVRPCNNYGPYQHPEKLIPRTIIRLIHGKPAIIYGDGSQIRDWIYVEDTAKAILTVLEKGSDYEIYNICGNMFASVKEVVTKILRIMNIPENFIVYAKPRPGEDRRYAMKCDKIRGLGWEPQMSLDQGLEITVRWYLENRWWWEQLLDEKYVLADTPW
ncbi:MAG: NAD-dependent epimerase/dehydratase family protein [Ignisphaera sp.]